MSVFGPALIDTMTPDQEREWLRELRHPDDRAVCELLAAGHPIVYCEFNTPQEHVIRKYPDGRRELIHVEITLDGTMRETLVRSFAPAA